MEYIKAVIKCEIKVMDPPLKSVRGVGKQSGEQPVGVASTLFICIRGEEFERRTGPGTKKNLRLDKKG